MLATRMAAPRSVRALADRVRVLVFAGFIKDSIRLSYGAVLTLAVAGLLGFGVASSTLVLPGDTGYSHLFILIALSLLFGDQV